jgi:hypothetical protein
MKISLGAQAMWMPGMYHGRTHCRGLDFSAMYLSFCAWLQLARRKH